MLLSLLALASADGAVPSPAAPEIVVVTASNFNNTADALNQGVAIVTREQALLASISGGIGETLSGAPGIRSTFYGTNASRPIIRGLGEDRIRLLLNGLAGIDASTISPDHAPAIEGLDADRIEVLKGPAALRFGGNAVGGVVNVVDGRLPEALPTRPVEGAFFFGTSSAEEAKSGAFRMSATTGQFVVRIDGLARSSDDYAVPGFVQTTALRAQTGDDSRDIAFNTRGEVWAFGASSARITERTNIAASVRTTNSNYGIPGEEAFIDLEQTRFDARMIVNDIAFLETLTVSATGGDYRHSEIEFDGAIGTVFKNAGYEARIEARHKPFGQIDGLWGLQFGETDFSAEGEEAFILPVTIKQAGLFGFERYQGNNWGVEIGARVENRDYSGLAGQRSFDFGSVAASAFVTPISGLRFSLNVSRTQRAPTEVELFADGPHAATGAFERGDPNLKIETATSVEGGISWQIGNWRAQADVWQSEFDGFINFTPTGEIEDDLPLYETSQRNATLKGLELTIRGTLWTNQVWSAIAELGADYVDGRYQDGDRIARIPPRLIRLGLEGKSERLRVKADVEFLDAQEDIAAFETPTEGATIYNLRATWQILPDQPDFALTVEGRNLTDEEVREHTSFLKDSLPKPGRSVRVGLRVPF
jgi:iron complex outermembrane recepter protein